MSLQNLAQSVLAKDYQLVICGYRIGGARAQAATVLLHQHLKDLGLMWTRIRCITFGQPKVVSAAYIQVNIRQCLHGRVQCLFVLSLSLHKSVFCQLLFETHLEPAVLLWPE